MKKFYVFAILMLTMLSFEYSAQAQLILYHPRNVTKCATKVNTTVTFSVTVLKTVIFPSYQWEALTNIKGAVYQPIPGATSRTLELDFGVFTDLGTLTTDYNNYKFKCKVVSGKTTQYSNEAVLTVNTSPSIYSQPSSATKNVGESVSFSCGASGETSHQWQFEYGNITGATSSSYAIASVNESHEGNYRYLATNSCGTVYSSTAVLTVNPIPEFPDGWSQQVSSTDKTLKRIDALDELNAVAVANNSANAIKITSDGGETWTPLTATTGANWYSVAYPAANKIIVGGYSYINTSTDGGATWSVISFYTNFGLSISTAVYDIEFIDATNGFACGMNGLVMKTTDGGLNWTLLNFNDSDPYVTDAHLYDIHFLNSTTGWAVGESGVIIKTVDGGITWTKINKANYMQGVSFGDANNGVAVASSYKYILRTSDGGDTWDVVDAANLPYIYPYSVTHTGPLTAYVTGFKYVSSVQYGIILKTIDGGVSWEEQWTDDINNLNDIVFVDADNGWAVGNSGEIQRTASGGCFTPKVDLYADQSFCASGSILMVADTFSTNLNCDYQWNKDGVSVSTNGSLTAVETGAYSVEVTSLCGVSAKDTLNVFVFELPIADAGEDVTICDGDSTQLIGSGGITYSWHDAQYLNYNDIQNPLASPNVGSTKFELTVTDENGCVNIDEVYVTVNAIPTATFTAPGFTCGDETANFSHTGTAGIDIFYWSFEDSITSAGTTTTTPTANWEATNLGLKNIQLVVDKLGCVSDTIINQLEVRVVPTADFTAPYAVCSDEAASLDYTGTAPGDASYTWTATGGTVTGSGQAITVSYDTEGTKAVSLEVVQDECSSGPNQMDVIASYPFNEEEICLVTIDLETGKNMVVWEKTPDVGVAEYRVYKESNIAGTYNILEAVSVDSISLYVDLESDPEKKQELYKISVVDTCGYESDLSSYHKTMFLQYVSSDNGVNLTWQDYGVEDGSLSFESYIIFRGSDSTQLEELETISSSLNAYTDTDVDALSQRMYYRVAGVKPAACDPAGLNAKKAGSGPFVHSMSNLEDNRMASGISDQIALSLNLKLYPNPFNNYTSVSYDLKKDSNVKIELYNILGERISILENDKKYAGNHTLEINASEFNYQEGLYYIRLYVDNQNVTRKIILKK